MERPESPVDPNRRNATLTTLAAALPLLLPAAEAEDPFVRLELPNGVTAAILHVEDAPKQSFFTFLPAGLYGDGAHRAQFAHVAEHMLIRSTDPASLQADGFEINGETTGSSLRLDSYAEPAKWRESLERHARWVAAREVDGEVLEREKQRIAGELEGTVPRGYTHKWAMAAWSQIAGAGLEHAAVRGDVDGASVEEVASYLKERMPGARRIHIVAAGPVSPEELAKALEEEFGKLPAEPATETVRPKGKTLAKGDLRATWDLEARHYLEWYPIPAEDPATLVAVQLLAQHAFFSFATSGHPGLTGGKALVALDLSTPHGRALTVNVALDEKTDVGELRAAIRSSLDGLFAENAAGGVAGTIQRTRMQLGQLPDFASLRQQMGERGTLIEAQTALTLSMEEIRVGLTLPEILAQLEALEPATVEKLAGKILAEKRRSSLLLEPGEKQQTLAIPRNAAASTASRRMRAMETPSASWNPAELTAHAEWVRGLALHLVRDSARADDLVQETFLAALERRPDQGRSLRPWLRRVLQNRFAFGQRSDARRLAREEEGASPEELPSSDELVENAEAHAMLVRALTRLREPYRTTLLLRYFEGKSPQEIAASQGLPAATVRSHLKRGLDELREQLDRRSDGNRRAWALALIPLAAASRDAIPPGGAISSLIQPIRAMNPLTQMIVGSTVVLTTAIFVAQQVEFLPPGEVGPGTITAGGGAASVPSNDGESTSAVDNHRESVAAGSTWLASTSEDVRITGVVVDAESGTPLPGFALELQSYTIDADEEVVFDDEGAESVVTGDDGSFETERTYASGTQLSLRMIDALGICRVMRSRHVTWTGSNAVSSSRTWNPEEAPIQLRVPIGPTYTLALTAPFDWPSTELIAYLGVSEEEPWSVLEHCTLMRAPVRGSSVPYVRFRRDLSYLPEDRPWILHVETVDGLFGGDVQVPAGNGLHEGVVPITLQPTAKLLVNLVSDAGVSSSMVIAQAVNGNTRRVLLGGAQEQQPDGRFRCGRVICGIPPGEYDLLVTCGGVEPIQETVTLLPGEMFTHDIEIQQAPGVSHIRGELHSVSGQYHDRCMICLQPRPKGDWKWVQPTWEERDGEWFAPFEIESLAEGEYDLVFFSLMDYYRWTPLPATITPPVEELVLTCHDTDPVRTLKFKVTDVDSGESIPRAFAYLTAEGCAQSQTSMATIIPGVPVDASFTWWLTADGYVPLWGDENDVSGQEPFKDEILDLIEVEMEPGWGARIDARQLGSLEPLEGVEVIVDDVVAGTTDATGMFELILEEKPLSVELRRDGWLFVHGGYDPDQAELTGGEPTHRVLFEPDV